MGCLEEGDMNNWQASLGVFNNANVIAHYSNVEGLQPVEQYLFEKYVVQGMHVVDIGVGGGRTTPFLSQRADRYLGIDYSQAMVIVCEKKFPSLAFACADATNLGFMPDGSFDLAIFSANGIDYIPTDAGRRHCLSELHRITKLDGMVIFSSHNAKQLLVWPALRGAGMPRWIWRLLRSIYKSVPLAIRTIRSGGLSRGTGYVVDPGHWGSLTHVSTPESVASDAQLAGFEIAEVVGGHFPASTPSYLTNWYYYVLRKVHNGVEQMTASHETRREGE
jgi:ubiquinone/menaquinone biosynthesis C-methylase UbiE